MDALDRADALLQVAAQSYRDALVTYYHERTPENRKTAAGLQAEYEVAYEHYLNVLMGAVEE